MATETAQYYKKSKINIRVVTGIDEKWDVEI